MFFLRAGGVGDRMDIGIVCQNASTGGWRYAVTLATALARLSDRPRVTLWSHVERLPPGAADRLRGADVRLADLPGRLPRPLRQSRRRRLTGWRRFDEALVAMWQRSKLRRRERYGRRLARVLAGHDVVHFAWPYDLDPPPVAVPMSFIPHDFIYAHEFGVTTYDHVDWTTTRASHRRWLDRAAPVVSSDFVAAELRAVFSDHRGAVDVIPLSSLLPASVVATPPAALAARWGLPADYVLCPNNLMPHKNLGALVSALWHLRRAGTPLKLVVCGPDTAGVRAVVRSPLYADRVDAPGEWDVLGLGMVGDDDLAGLLAGALVVVNPSLCEAGSGSALDAWSCGSAVALADIPAFRDQVRALGTRAEWFDPRDPRDIARMITGAAEERDRLAADGAASRATLARYGWDEVARRYMAVFTRLVAA